MISSKGKVLSSTFLSAALLLGACGDKEEVSDPPTTEAVESEFGFTSFDLDIDTAEQRDAVEASFEVETNGVEAEYVNSLDSQKLHGDEAYEFLKPIFTDLALTNDMTKEEVIEKVNTAFGISDYTEFDLEILYEDGQEIEYKDNK
ncbi:YusW family protein [Psychrobacillus sp. FSL W7-1457]|uniref:YusW family protein n=1 Tax=unclassified Psychrobacillus TaxID=2636677 RepID=UPI0030F9CC97